MSTTCIEQVTVSGEEKTRELDLIGSTARVTIEIGADADRCKNCHQEVVEYPAVGLVHDHGDLKHCDLISEDEADEDTPFAELTNRGPGEFVNWIGANVNEDSVTVEISVGEPRGSLVMTVWQGEDEEGNPRLYLSVPTHVDPAPHVQLVPYSSGTYVINV